MIQVAEFGDRRYTLREVAEATGASYRTVAAYAQKAGWTQNGKITLLTEEQVTVIVEAMKVSTGQGGKRAAVGKERLALAMQGIDTSKSRVLRLQYLQQQMQEIYEAELAELKAENKALASDLQATQNLLDQRTEGLSTIQRIAEAGGLLLSDRDDLLSAYRRMA
jgi:DNA-binding transcriptional MerR regulator